MKYRYYYYEEAPLGCIWVDNAAFGVSGRDAMKLALDLLEGPLAADLKNMVFRFSQGESLDSLREFFLDPKNYEPQLASDKEE